MKIDEIKMFAVKQAACYRRPIDLEYSRICGVLGGLTLERTLPTN